MASVPSSCRMVARGDADPLEWRRLCLSLSSVPKLSPWSFASIGSQMSPFQSLPVSNIVSILPLEPPRMLTKCSWSSNGAQKPPSKDSRSEMASVADPLERRPSHIFPFNCPKAFQKPCPSFPKALAVSRGRPARNGVWRPPAVVGRTGRR